MLRNVLFIDDDRRLIQRYARAVESRQCAVHREYDVDKALEYARATPRIDVIGWDMAMPPGKNFEEQETEGGLETGRFLYEELRKAHPAALFILLTGHVNEYDKKTFLHPDQRSHIFVKLTTSPESLAEFITEKSP